MSFTYDPASPIGQVRFKVGDTDEATAVLTDEEINQLLAEHSDHVLRAAVSAARSLAARFGRDYDFTTDDQSYKRSQRAKAFENLADRLEAELKESGGLGVIGTVRKDGYGSTAGSLDGDNGVGPGGRARDQVKYSGRGHW